MIPCGYPRCHSHTPYQIQAMAVASAGFPPLLECNLCGISSHSWVGLVLQGIDGAGEAPVPK